MDICGESGYPGSMKPKIQITTDDSKDPICPHCEQEIQTIHVREIESVLGVRFLYYCARCSKVLGISHRKGFWMG